MKGETAAFIATKVIRFPLKRPRQLFFFLTLCIRELKWDSENSSASFYEKGIKKYQNLVCVNDALASEVPGSPFAQTPTR